MNPLHELQLQSFIAPLDPTVDEMTEIKTVVSEAVTNAIIHGYQNEPDHFIKITCTVDDYEIKLRIEDNGLGIEDIESAREPLYSCQSRSWNALVWGSPSWKILWTKWKSFPIRARVQYWKCPNS